MMPPDPSCAIKSSPDPASYAMYQMRNACPSSDHPGSENPSANPPNQLLPRSVQVSVVDQRSYTAAACGAASSSNTSTSAEAFSASTS